MLKTRLKLFFVRTWPYFLVLFFILLIAAGVWTNLAEYAEGDDLFFHITRLKTATEALADGQIIPQINPSAALGFGYAYNLFYGPILTWLAGVLNLILNHWTIVFNLVILLCWLAAGLTMCYAVKKISKTRFSPLLPVFCMSPRPILLIISSPGVPSANAQPLSPLRSLFSVYTSSRLNSPPLVVLLLSPPPFSFFPTISPLFYSP